MVRAQLSSAWAWFLGGAALASTALLGYRRYARRTPNVEEELGTFVYSFPLDVEEDEEGIAELESNPDVVERARIDEEMFPGFQE